MDRPKYTIEIFWSDEDGGYIANVPDLTYCSAFGESYEEALREVLVAMELYLDTLMELGRPLPELGSGQRFGGVTVVLDTGRAAEGVGQVAGQIVDETGEIVGMVVGDVGEGAGQMVGGDLESHPELTPRESEVLQLIAQGKSGREIAEDLSVTYATVQQYVTEVIRSLGTLYWTEHPSAEQPRRRR